MYEFDPNLTTSAQIDWNRDGVISGGPVRATTRYIAVQDCAVSDIHELAVSMHPTSTMELDPIRVPAHAEMNGLLWIFATTWSPIAQGQFELRQIAFASELVACTGPNTPSGCCPTDVNGRNLCGSWTGSTQILVSGTLDSSPSVIVESSNGTPRLMLVYATVSQGTRRIIARQVYGLGNVGPEVQVLTVPGGPFGRSPDAARLADPFAVFVPSAAAGQQLQIFYADLSGNVRRAFLNSTYSLVADQGLLQPPGIGFPPPPSEPLVSAASPAATLGPDGVVRVVAIESGARAAIYRVSPSSSIVLIPKVEVSDSSVTIGRPSIAFQVPGSSTDHGVGVELTYSLPHPSGNGRPARVWSDNANNFAIQSTSLSAGSGALGGVGVGTYKQRLVSLVRCTRNCAVSGDFDLQLFPFWTGVFAFPDTDHNDFATLREWLCPAVKANHASDVDCPGSSCPDPCVDVGALSAEPWHPATVECFR